MPSHLELHDPAVLSVRPPPGIPTPVKSPTSSRAQHDTASDIPPPGSINEKTMLGWHIVYWAQCVRTVPHIRFYMTSLTMHKT